MFKVQCWEVRKPSENSIGKIGTSKQTRKNSLNSSVILRFVTNLITCDNRLNIINLNEIWGYYFI